MAQSGSEERKTLTILAMDVASYSQKMGADEEGTLKNLKPVEKSLRQKSLKPREEYLILLVMLYG